MAVCRAWINIFADITNRRLGFTIGGSALNLPACAQMDVVRVGLRLTGTVEGVTSEVRHCAVHAKDLRGGKEGVVVGGWQVGEADVGPPSRRPGSLLAKR